MFLPFKTGHDQRAGFYTTSMGEGDLCFVRHHIYKCNIDIKTIFFEQ